MSRHDLPATRPYKPSERSASTRRPPLTEQVFSEFVARDRDELPDSRSGREMLAPVLTPLAKGNVQAACRAAARLAAQRPGENFFAVELARLLLSADQNQEAVDILRRVLENNPFNIEALNMLAFQHIQQGAFIEALELLGQAVGKKPSDTAAQINLHFVSRRIKPPKSPIKQEATVSPTISLATSIPPFDQEVSRKAVDSWLQHGFRVLSVNNEEEYKLLAPCFPEVEFYLCEKNAFDFCGTHQQYLDSLLNVLAAEGDDICGLINADIILNGERGLAGQLAEAARDHFVFGPRVNVEHLSDRQGGILELGADWFLFPKEYLLEVPPTKYVFGQPFWDLFFPIWATHTGMPVRFAYSPLALHKRHAIRWNPTNNSRFFLHLLEWLAPDLLKLLLYQGCSEYLGALQKLPDILFRAIRGQAKPFFCAGGAFNEVIAPVDPVYWLRTDKETMIYFG